MTPEIKALYLLAAKVGHRTPPGHRSHNVAGLLSVKAEHPRHAERIRRELARQTAGLAKAMAGAKAWGRQQLMEAEFAAAHAEALADATGQLVDLEALPSHDRGGAR